MSEIRGNRMSGSLPDCHDCGVHPGELHEHGCDTARCRYTGMQRIACDGHHDHGRDVWTGLWPGDMECDEYGIELNDLYQFCEWDRDKGRWIIRPAMQAVAARLLEKDSHQ